MNLQNWALLILLATIWGGSFLFGRIIVAEMPPLTLVFWRVFLGGLALYIYLYFYPSNFKITPRHWLMFAIMGVLNNIIPFALIFYGQLEIGAGLASIINAMTPICTLLIAHFATQDEKIVKHKFFGIVICFGGVALLIGVPNLENISGTFLAQISVLGATISYGCASVYGRRFANIPPLETSKGQLCMSTIIMLPIVLFVDKIWQLEVPSLTVIFCILALALVCTAFAYLLFFTILARAGAVNVSLVTLLVPISSILLGTTILGESLTLSQFVAMFIILGGLLIVDGRPLKLLKKLF